MRFYKGTCTTMELDSSFVKTFSQDLQNCRDLFAALGDEVRQQILLCFDPQYRSGNESWRNHGKNQAFQTCCFPSYPHFKKCRDYRRHPLGNKKLLLSQYCFSRVEKPAAICRLYGACRTKIPKKHCTAGETISVNSAPMNLLVTLNASYLAPLNVMLFSLMRSNPTEKFNIYLLHNNLSEELLLPTRKILGGNSLYPIQVQEPQLKDAPVSKRYPQEMYFRIFAAQYLPEGIDRVLYLDPDIIINGSLQGTVRNSNGHGALCGGFSYPQHSA